MPAPHWIKSDPRYKRPNLSIHLTDRVSIGEIKVFGRMSDESGTWWDLVTWLEVDGEKEAVLPQTRGGDYWFTVDLPFGLHRIQTMCYHENERITSEEKKFLSLGGLSSNIKSWIPKTSLEEVVEKARQALEECYERIEFEEGILIGRVLTRGWTWHDIDLKLVNPDLEKERFLNMIEYLNTKVSKAISFPVDICLEEEKKAYGHEKGVYDLSGIREARWKLMTNGKIREDTEPEIKEYEGENGAIYKEGEELAEEEIREVES